MADQRLPVVNSDDGAWGTLLVQYLTKEHYQDATGGVDFAANGSHKNVTIFPGTTTAAPLTFNSSFTNKAGTTTTAALLSTPANGAMEYDGTYYYLTQGGVRRRIDNYGSNTITAANYSITAADSIIFANAASNSIQITLPAASGLNGYRYYVKRIDPSTNTVTILRSGTDTIDGQTSLTLDLQYTALALVSNGSAWYIL